MLRAAAAEICRACIISGSFNFSFNTQVVRFESLQTLAPPSRRRTQLQKATSKLIQVQMLHSFIASIRSGRSCEREHERAAAACSQS
jgi:hypothetical protein